MKNKKQKIINYLKRKGLSSTTAIATYIKANDWQTNEYLKILEQEKKIQRMSLPTATYWDIEIKLPEIITANKIEVVKEQ